MSNITENLEIEATAWKSKFYKIPPKKITAENLVLGFWEMQKKGKHTLRNWAVECGVLLNKDTSISKQAIDERLNSNCLGMVEILFKKALNFKYKKAKEELNTSESLQNINHLFNRILLQDSTIQSLPANLCLDFPASHTSGKKAAMLRLQSIFDLTNMTWLSFFIGSFRNNDQSQTMLINEVVKKNDLLLRDLGYFTLDSLDFFTKNQYVITKWDNQSYLYYDSNVFNHKQGEKIDLLKLFKGRTEIDIPVQIGSKKRVKMRLVAKKLPKTQARARIEAAKKNRHSKSNHSEDYYKLLKWEIYLTNVECEKLNIEQIAKLYGLRWYIEILFKSWKSYANFKKMLGKEKMNYTRMMITIYLLLIQFVYFMLDIFNYISKRVAEKTDRLISILKFMDVVGDLFDYIIRIQKLSDLDNLIPQFVAHATYERRNKRKNMMQKCLFFKDLCSFSFAP